MHSLALTDRNYTFTGHEDDFNKMDDDAKIAVLQEMFPTAKSYDIKHTLKKSNAQWSRVVENLLTQAFLESGEEKLVMRGVDAFSEEHVARRGRKKQSRKFIKIQEEGSKRASSLPAEASANMPSSWETAKHDVDFISERMAIPHKIISSIYHAHAASLPDTITALLESSAQDGVEVSSDDPVVQAHAYELGREFPTVPASQLTALIRLTHPSTTSAHELATALTSIRMSAGSAQIQASYLPLDRSASPSPPRSLASRTYMTSSSAAVHSAAAHQAMSQASAAYRRGRSDKLMGQAAAYYSQLGRDHALAGAGALSGAADALVAAQSTATSVDLHGVTVKDAVRIARQKTESWSNAKGRRVMGMDGRVREEAGSGAAGATLRIITGVGRHSDGGVAKIGPAVGKMLLQEGWKFEVGPGSFLVIGRKR